MARGSASSASSDVSGPNVDDPAEEDHLAVAHGAGRADRLRERDAALDGDARLFLRAHRRQREAHVDGERRLARLQTGGCGGARCAPARFERRADVTARLADHGERLPRVDRGAGNAVRARQLEERVGDVRGLVELAGERETRRERRRAARLLVEEPRRLRATDDVLEPRARVGSAAAGVFVANACAERAHLARFVVDGVLHRAHGGVALAGARIEAVPRFVEDLRARELRRLVLGERERLLGEAHRLAERVRGERTPSRFFQVVRGLHRLAAELEMARDDRVVLAHLARATARRARGGP